MRTIIVAGVIGISFMALHAATSPASAQHCELINCSVECWWVGPGHRRCQRHCTRRCWRPAPQYIPQPEPYYAPQYHSAPQFAAPFPIDPHVALVGLGVVAVLLITLLAAVFNAAATSNEIAEIEQSSFSARAEADAAEHKTLAITSYMASAEADAFEQGRRSVDDEYDWKEFTRHE